MCLIAICASAATKTSRVLPISLVGATFYNHGDRRRYAAAEDAARGPEQQDRTVDQEERWFSVVRRVPINNLDGNGWNVSRTTLQLLVNQVMAEHKLDALVYPTKTIPAPRVATPVEPANIKVVKETITTMIDGEPHERTVDRVIDARAPLTWRFSPNGGFPHDRGAGRFHQGSL